MDMMMGAFDGGGFGWGKEGGGKGWGKGGFAGGGKGKMMPWMAGPYGKDGGGKGAGKGAWGKDGGKAGANKWSDTGWDNSWKPGEYFEEPGTQLGIEGLKDAITRAVEPHAPAELKWSKPEMINKLCMNIFNISSKWWKNDPRHKETGTAIQAQALLEEFTEKLMSGLAATCSDKPWFLEIYLSEAVALAAINTFKGGALFKRTVAPIIVTHVDEAIFRYREEERHSVVMWDAVSSVGIKADYLKKANKHLGTSFEAAHISAKYGTSPAATPELGMVQDFVSAWLQEFSQRGWDILNNGINNPTQDQQVGVLTTLFQYLCDPAHSCLPHDLTSQLDAPPPANWDFIAAEAIKIMTGA